MESSAESRIHGFAPLARADARILILGSMPSRESLAKKQYYAHPRNAFWPIVREIFEVEATDYGRYSDAVTRRGVAIWDVLRDCIRPGSLDSAIDEKTAAVNDFRSFFESHPNIHHVFFNGAKAESMYLRRVLPGLEPAMAAIPRTRLPSTSPANAGINFEARKKTWQVIRMAR